MADEQKATKTKVIAGESFEISQPYAEGHTLTAIEAKVLNQVRGENIANNMRNRVKAAIAGEEGAPSMADVKKEVAEYDAGYTFTLTGVSSARKLDPVEREGRSMAREAIKAMLAEQGRKIGEVDKDKLEAAIDQVLENDPEIMKAAKKRVAEKNKVLETTTAGLDL